MASSKAILIEYAKELYAAIAFAHMEEVLDEPASIHVPLAPLHCNTLIEWRGDWLPLFDLNIWSGSLKDEAKHFCAVISYQSSQDASRRYGCLRSISFPHIVEVDDLAAAPLPHPRWKGFAKACFKRSEQAIPVLDLAALYETPAKQIEAITDNSISNPKTQVPISKVGQCGY